MEFSSLQNHLWYCCIACVSLVSLTDLVAASRHYPVFPHIFSVVCSLLSHFIMSVVGLLSHSLTPWPIIFLFTLFI